MKGRAILQGGALLAVLAAVPAWASAVQGTVRNKSTGKPSAGDKVVLVDVSKGMTDTATAKTDAGGRFTLSPPGVGPYLVRAEHQGGSYFVAAPKEGAVAEIGVYDTAEKVEGVGMNADLLLIEATAAQINGQERFVIRNESQPPRAQFSSRTFEFVLPESAVLDVTTATRPGGMATQVPAVALKQKGHYAINVPIQPSQGDKTTIFEVQFHLPYNGSFDYTMQPTMAAGTVEIYLAKGIEVTAPEGFERKQLDERVQSLVAENVSAGKKIVFTVRGQGEIPRESGEKATGGSSSAPGGGMGAPSGSPDPLSRYKGWILAGLVLLMAASAAFFLRRQGAGQAVAGAQPQTAAGQAVAGGEPSAVQHFALGPEALMATLKEELFALESARLSGAIDESEYAEAKAALETLIKRALKRM